MSATETPSQLLRRIMSEQLFGFEDKLAVLEIAHMLELSTQATRDVLAERRRQIKVEGWTPEHDDEHDTGDLALAAAAYAINATALLHPGPSDTRISPRYWLLNHASSCWPWDRKSFKTQDVRRSLVKATSLLLAELERRDRAAGKGAGS